MKVNGKEVKLTKDMTLLEYLQVNRYNGTKVTVERNGEVVPKAEYRTVILNNKDEVSIVRYLGGK